MTNKRSKHIDHPYHMIRDYNNSGIIKLNYISTAHNTAEITTKVLDKIKHRYFANNLLQYKEALHD